MRFAVEPPVAAEGIRNPLSGPLPSSISDSGLPRDVPGEMVLGSGQAPDSMLHSFF